MEFYFIRHTRVGIAPGICYGQTDIPLAESFDTEAEQVQQKLPERDGAMMYSSPLRRCRALAERLNPSRLEPDPRLMELNFGEWEMQHWDSISAGTLRSWTGNFVNQRCPGGESYRDQFDRAVEFWNQAQHSAWERVFVVTHAGTIRTLLAHVLEIPLDKSLRINLDFGSVTKMHLVEDIPIVDYINR